MKKKSIITRTVLLVVIVLSVASFATADVNVDLSGEYWFGSLSADATTNVPWGERGTVVVAGDNWSQDWDDQDGHHTFSSTFTASVQSDSSININLSSGTYNVAWNGDVMIHADNTPDADNRLGIDIIARKATNLTLTDVIGNYSFFGHQLNSVDRSDSDEWGSIVFKTNGTAAYKFVNDQGHSESHSLNWTLDAINAMLNISGQTSPNGLLLSKGGIDLAFQVLPSEGVDNDLGYNVFVKKTTHTITRADMAGTYQFRFLESGPDGVPYTCGQGTVIFNADGSYSVDAYYSDGEHDTHNGTYTVGLGNQITIIGGQAIVSGIISSDKNLIFAAEYTSKHLPRHSDDWIGGFFIVREPNSTPILQFGNLSGTKNTKLVVNDACNVLVTFSLTGGGYAELTGGANFDQITLYDTGDKSQLTISTKGNALTNVGSIICNETLKGITAKTTTFNGDITINGTSSNPKSAVTITFDKGENLNITSQMPIKSIAAMDWDYGSLTAPSAGSITLKANSKLDRWGYLGIDINVAGAVGSISAAGEIHGTWNCKSIKSLTMLGTEGLRLTLSQEPNSKVPALGKLTAKEYFEYSRIISSGNIGTVTVGELLSSSCFAGVADACLVNVNANDSVLDLPPVLDDTFSQDATIKSFTVKGFKGLSPPYFINSNIAAKNITSISIAYPQYANSGTPFGISTYNDPATIKIKDANGTHSWKKGHIGDAVDWLSQNGGDMELRRD
jgi:hypothetical protein